MLYTAYLLTELLQGKGMWLWDTGDCVAFGVKARHFSQHVSEPGPLEQSRLLWPSALGRQNP